MTPAGLSDEEFHDFVGGRLGAADRARIEAHLARHPGDRARVADCRAQIAWLHALYDDALAEPVPAAMRARLGGTGGRRLRHVGLALVIAALAGLGAWRLVG